MANNWKFRLDHDFTWSSGRSIHTDLDFRCENDGEVRLKIAQNGDITVIADYAWDGCSPKIKVMDWVYLGTPDGTMDWATGKPVTWEASMIHDALYQFRQHADMPFTRRDMDEIFRDILRQKGFSLSTIYFWGVRLFGSAYSACSGSLRRLWKW